MNYNEMTKEELIQLLEDNENITGKYGLVWDKEKEPERIVEECDKAIPVLKKIDNKTINNAGSDNVLICGDNFHSLSVLNYTHKESVDVIYIDPPYNTGHEDFMYNDKFVDLEDGYRHSKWINFIQKRLKLAKGILRDEGIIFISIDDNEFAQLKLLCDKIFGENNMVAIFNWKKTSTPPSLSKNVRKKFEYVLCYKKNQYNNGLNGGTVEGGDMPLLNGSNAYGTLKFKKESVIFKIPDGFYSKGEKDRVVLEQDINIINGVSDNDVVLSGNFKWKQDTVDQEIENGTKFFIKSDKFAIRYQRDGLRIKVPSNIISKEECEVGTNEDATKELQKIFDSRSEVFSHPKPVSLIKYLINMITFDNKNATILDFFAGSGTTGQAVLELNNEDGGNRKFILCTNNEGDICDEVTYPRLKTIITGKRTDNSIYSDGLRGSLNCYETEFVENSNNRDQLYFDLTEKCIPMLSIKDGNYTEYKSTNEYVIFRNNDSTKYTCVYYSLFGDKEAEFINELKNISAEKTIYKFALGDSFDLSIFDGITNYNVEAIPYRIVELYKKIVKMSRED